MEINILMVDDDQLFVEKLEEGISFEELGISMVFTANNIRQAKKILEEYPVQIMVSDIEMPQGSGLELLQWARNKNLILECVFLSSYAYFAYAQKALSLNTSEYMLKPVSNQELEKIITKLIRKISENSKTDEKADDEKEEDEKNLYWGNILQHKKKACSGDYQEEFYQENDRFYISIVKAIPNSLEKSKSEMNTKKEISILNFSVQTMIADFFREQNQEVEVMVKRSDYEWFCVFRKRVEGFELFELLSRFRNTLMRSLSMEVCVYISKKCGNKDAIVCRENLEKMEQNAILGMDGVLSVSDWERKVVGDIAPPWKIWEKEMVCLDDLSEVKENIVAFLVSSWNKNRVTSSTLMQFRKEFLQCIYYFLNRQNVSIGTIFGDSEFDECYDLSVGTLYGMKIFITYTMERLNGFKKQDNKQESVVEQIKLFVEQHLGDDLSRKKLAQKVFLSEDYVSKMFISTVGMSIPNYVASRRIKKAQEYLKESHLSVSQVAMEVGYHNFSYFSKSFRDYVGCSPNEYRCRIQRSTSV